MAQKYIVFDSGPVISLAINNLLWVLEGLKKDFKGEFYITPAVYDEVINKPLNTRKYKLEALQVLPHITNNTLRVYKHPTVKRMAEEIDYLANHSFKIHNNWVRIVHRGEIETIASALHLQAHAVCIDERTTRHLIEKPERIAEHMERKIHAEVSINWKNLNAVKKKVQNLRVIRSIELITIGFEKGLFQHYLEAGTPVIPNLKSAVLEGALWGVKLNGCSVKEKEIQEILKMEK